MENMSKALLISAGVLVGIILLAIFVYEIAEVSNIAKSIQEKQYEKRISEFNAQFEGFASRNTRGYLGIKDAISVQEFAKIYDMALEWNKSNPSEKIIIQVESQTGAYTEEGHITTTAVSGTITNKIRGIYLPALSTGITPAEPIENLFREMGGSGNTNDIQTYFFEFKAENMEYSSLTRRVKSIKMNVKKL